MIANRKLYLILVLACLLVGPVGPAADASADAASIRKRIAARTAATRARIAASTAATRARITAANAARAARRGQTSDPDPTPTPTPEPTPTPTPDTTRPSTPRNLNATATSCGDVRLFWTGSSDSGGSGLVGYDIWRNNVYMKRVLAPLTSTSDGSPGESTQNSYKVQAFDGAGNRSTTSASASATTPACDVPEPPDPGPVSGPGPQVVGAVGVGGEIWDVAADDLRDLAVVTSPGAKRLTVVSLDDPEAPEILGTLVLEYKPVGIALGGNYAYVVEVVPGNPSGADLAVVDLSSPANPTLKARLPIPGSFGGGEGVAVDGTLVYVATTSAGLQVVDVSSPSAPRIIGAASAITDSRNRVEAAVSVELGDGVAFVLGRFGELQVLDTSDPVRPVEITSFGLSAEAIALTGDVLGLSWGNQYHAWDVSNPGSPSVAAKSNVQETRDVAITDSLLAVGTESGVSLFDRSSVIGGRFESLGDAATPAELRALVFSGNLVLAGDKGGTLSVISID